MVWYVWWKRHSLSSPAMLATAQTHSVASGTMNSRIILPTTTSEPHGRAYIIAADYTRGA